MASLGSILNQADKQRFKLLAIVGKNETKKQNIIEILENNDWQVVDVESELMDLKENLEKDNKDFEVEIGTQIKKWFKNQPNNIILTNASILYHDIFMNISPIGAFKYSSRNKNCVIFLEDEEQLGNRLYYSKVDKDDYYETEIRDILKEDIDDISLEYEPNQKSRTAVTEPPELKENAIGNLFDFHKIKDVFDIDSDINEAESRKKTVSSYIISDSLETQILEFFDDLAKPKHKARTIVGNYGSGKSHLLGFLVSLVENPNLGEYANNSKIADKVKNFDRDYLTIQFELQPQKLRLSEMFFGKIRNQLKNKYDIEVPQIEPTKSLDNKKDIANILEIIKQNNPQRGLLVVIDEISDFLDTKDQKEMNADVQFLRVVAQTCQNNDIMFVASMQEDIFSSPKFVNIGDQVGRVKERFQNINIHKEDIKKVISERIVPKSSEHLRKLEDKFQPYAEKIDNVSKYFDDYIELFPLTPFLIELFSDLPYFEKRGAIQFAISEIKYILNEEFPYFLTFEKIFNYLKEDPNKRSIEEIHKIIKVMDRLSQKIKLLEDKYQEDAEKIIKGLAVYSLWNEKEEGATAQELANNLMILPQNKNFTAADNITLIIGKIREATEGEYIKIREDKQSGKKYFHFDVHPGVDPEEKISQKVASVTKDEVETELYTQLEDILDLGPNQVEPNIYQDESEWKSVKSFRKGLIAFIRKGYEAQQLPDSDYVITIISPFISKFDDDFSKIQLNIKLNFEGPEILELLKEVIAIRKLINSGFQRSKMTRKLTDRIEGTTVGKVQKTGVKFRISKQLLSYGTCEINNEKHPIKETIRRNKASVPEIVELLKAELLDEPFNEEYPLHPKYSKQLSNDNIVSTLDKFVDDLSQLDFTNLRVSTKNFLKNLNLLDSEEYPDISNSKIAQNILDKLKNKGNKVTSINDEIVGYLKKSDYGLEKEVVYFHLYIMTLLGKIFLQQQGGDRIDINNLPEKVNSLKSFESIKYAKLEQEGSYDYAARLMNTLGLNGNKILNEKDRLNAFKDYKEKVDNLLSDLQKIEGQIDTISEKQNLYVDRKQIENEYEEINQIEWNKLDIKNHKQFSKIEDNVSPIPQIKIGLHKINNLKNALAEYNTIHKGIDYMNNALDLLKDNKFIVKDIDKYKRLEEFHEDVINICGDFAKFIDKAHRNPVQGKIEQFKKMYKFDFYIPAHNEYVGKNVDWEELDNYQSKDLFLKISRLKDLNCTNESEFKKMVRELLDIKEYKCINPDIADDLNNSVRCSRCLFPEKENYKQIPEKIDKIEDDLVDMYNQFEETVVKEARMYRDNIEYLDTEDEKDLINMILEEKSLPDDIDNATIKTLNKLFKDIEKVELKKDDVLDKLFPGQKMITVEEFHKGFIDLENEIKENKNEDEIRIKLIDKEEE